MQFKLISDSHDTLVGLRLAGIAGVLAHTEDAVKKEIEKCLNDENIGIIMITARLSKLCRSYIENIKLNYKRPLVVEIPNRTNDGSEENSILSYIKEAIGMKI